MTHEQWKPIPGFEGLYEISNQGRVKSLSREAKGKNGSTRILPERILSPSTLPRGHKQVCLRKNGKNEPHRIHRLVALAFLGKPPILNGCEVPGLSPAYEKALVAHNDGNPANNHVSNLRYATTRENAQDRIKHGSQAAGESHGNAQLTDQIVFDIRRRFDAGEAIKEIAADYPWSAAHINNVARRYVWKHLP